MELDTKNLPKKQSNGRPPQENVSLGDIVFWFASPTSTPSPAIVTQVDRYTIRCSVFLPDVANVDPRDSVKHITDPTLQPTDLEDSGCWMSRQDWLSKLASKAAEQLARDAEAEANAVKKSK